ncbi:MAG: glycosyltransferase family 39 protein [Gemmatimonadales bacterium]
MLVIGGLLRLLAAVFSQGFLASDDHHVVITAADQIASGIGLPATYARSALFPGVLGAIMAVTRGLGIRDPGLEMLVIRLIQAAYSLLVVYFVYRILERASGRDRAMLGGLLTAAFFAMPVTAVHQLEESVCLVPLLAAVWWWQRCEDGRQPPAVWGVLAGAALGVALVLRFPLIGFVAAFVVLAMLRPVTIADKAAFAGGMALVIVLQGYSNALINHEWWYSFSQRLGPMLNPQRMAVEAEGYPSSPPWHYILTLLAALIPPASILLLGAAIKGGRQLPLLGITALAFLVSHSLIANKQERFLLPILPVLFILIVVGLPWLAARMGGGRTYRGMWWYFWTVNALLLIVVTFSSAKKDRVDPLLYVYRRHDATGVLVAQYNQTFHVPEYYLGPRPERPELVVVTATDDVQPNAAVNYVILYSNAPESDRAALAQALGRKLTLVKVITPSLADRLAHAINPRHNKARTAAIYTTS